MATYFTLLALLFVCNVLGRDAINHFIKHRKIKNMSVEEFNINNSSVLWIQYNFIFDNGLNLDVTNETLKIGVFLANSTLSASLECQLSKNASNELTIEGYDADIIFDFAEDYKIRYEIIVLEEPTEKWVNQVDVVLCDNPLIMSPEFLNSNEFQLYTTIKSNLVLLYKKGKLHFTQDIFILTFAGSLWIVFLIFMVVLALCLRMSTQKYSKIKKNYESWTGVEITLWAIAAACQQGLSHTPSGFASCAIFLLGYAMAYLLYTGLTAAITSVLVDNVDRFTNFESARAQDLHLVSLENIRPHIKLLQEKFLVTKYVPNLDNFFEEIDNFNRIGVGPEIVIKNYFNKNFNVEEIGSFHLIKLSSNYNHGFYIKANTLWRKLINKHVAILKESGILDVKFKRYYKHSTPVLSSNAGYSSAGIEHVGSAILMFFGAVGISLWFIVTEIVFFLYKNGLRPRTQLSSTISRS